MAVKLDLAAVFKREPVRIVTPVAFNVTDVSPAFLAYKRAVVLGEYRRIIGKNKVKEPVSKNATIAAGVASIVFDKSVKEAAMGARVYMSAGDNTPLSDMTWKFTFFSESGEQVIQTINGTPEDRNSGFDILFASASSDIAIPTPLFNGSHPVTDEVAPTIGSVTLTVDITGPSGMECSVQLLGPKHPAVLELYRLDLAERLIRNELGKKVTGLKAGLYSAQTGK